MSTPATPTANLLRPPRIQGCSEGSNAGKTRASGSGFGSDFPERHGTPRRSEMKPSKRGRDPQFSQAYQQIGRATPPGPMGDPSPPSDSTSGKLSPRPESQDDAGGPPAISLRKRCPPATPPARRPPAPPQPPSPTEPP